MNYNEQESCIRQQHYSDSKSSTARLEDEFHESVPHRSIDSFMDEAYQSSLVFDPFSRFKLQMEFWGIFVILGVCNCSDATEILALSYILGLDDEKSDFKQTILNNNLARNGGILASSIFLGMLVGGILVGVLGDEYGRKKVLVVGLIANCFAGIVSACAPNLIALACARFVAGVGIGGSIPPLLRWQLS